MGEGKNGTREEDTRGERERLPGRTMKIVSRPLSNYLAAAAWSVKNFDKKRLFEKIITIAKGFQIQAPCKFFISSIRSRFWWYTFHRQSKPRSSFWTTNISSDLHFNDSTNLLSAAGTNSIVKPPLTTTYLQRRLYFVPADKKSIHWLLFKTFLQWPPLYNGHFLVPKVAFVERFNCI